MTATSPLDWALTYADAGWHVFPCHPNKTPATEHGHLDATTDHAQIVSWWRKNPDACIGIATGPSGLVVIDLDYDPAKGKDGPTVFAQLAGTEPHGCALIASTPRGGRHHYYQAPTDPVQSRIGIRNGVDVKSDGGYVVAPDGRPGREWMVGEPGVGEGGTCDLMPMPEWVAELVASKPPTPEPPAVSASTRVRVEVASALHAIPPSVGRSTWLSAIFAAHAALGGDPFGAQLVEGWSALTDSAGQHKSGEAARAYQKADLPQDASEVDRGTLFALARSYGWRSAGSGADDVRIELEPKGKPVDGSIQGLDFEDVGQMPPIEWDVDEILPERCVAILAGDTGAGKSFLALDLALRMVHGMEFCGRVTQPGSVLLMAGEGHAGLAARIRAWMTYHPGKSRQGRFLTVLDGIPPLTAKSVPAIGAMLEKLQAHYGHLPKVVVIDTLSQGLVDGDENDAKVVGPILRELAILRTKYGVSFLLVHHLVKLTGKNGMPVKPTRDSVRGSGALTRNTDVVLGLVVDGGSRCLHIWKQKDAQDGQQIRLVHQVVQTGRHRRDGSSETSLVLIPEVDMEEIVESQEVADARKRKTKSAECVQRVVSVVTEDGGMMTRAEIRAAAGLKSTDCSAAIEQAVKLSLLANVGTETRPKYVTPEHPLSARAQNPTPKGRERERILSPTLGGWQNGKPLGNERERETFDQTGGEHDGTE